MGGEEGRRHAGRREQAEGEQRAGVELARVRAAVLEHNHCAMRAILPVLMKALTGGVIVVLRELADGD